MLYINAIQLFGICVLWSYALEQIAHFCIHNRFRTELSFYNQPHQIALLILCASSFYVAIHTALLNYPAYFILISALWITIHSDLQNMLISRFASLYLIPIGLLLSWYELLPLSFQESLITCSISAVFFATMNALFYLIKKQRGLGQGDIELIACIGAWVGILGTWFTILIGSVVGTICTGIYIAISGHRINKIPFGPFLASACLCYVLYQSTILQTLTFFL